jgi:hypothetical protein
LCGYLALILLAQPKGFFGPLAFSDVAYDEYRAPPLMFIVE